MQGCDPHFCISLSFQQFVVIFCCCGVFRAAAAATSADVAPCWMLGVERRPHGLHFHLHLHLDRSENKV